MGAHVGRGAVLTDYCLIAIAICTTAGRSSSVTLEPGQLSPQPTLDTANVFVFNQLLSNVVVNMQSLPRSSETAEQRVSDRFQSVLGHNVVEVRRLMSRERRVCRHSVIMHVVGVVVRLLSRPIVDGLLIAVGHTVVALLKLPMRPRCVSLRSVIVSVGLATVLKWR